MHELGARQDGGSHASQSSDKRLTPRVVADRRTWLLGFESNIGAQGRLVGT